jgi:predicted metallopeptidase
VRRYSKSNKLLWEAAPKVKKRVGFLVDSLDLKWIKKGNVSCFRSFNSKSRAVARIWGLPNIWQIALKQEANYVVEVISERFDKLDPKEQDRVLLHELTHIPKNFSGALLPHRRRGKGSFYERLRKTINEHERNTRK